jgi:hypothetical protein
VVPPCIWIRIGTHVPATSVIAEVVVVVELFSALISRDPYVDVYEYVDVVLLIYNDAQNLGIRIGTIPLEDFFYNMVYMLWMITVYEILRKKHKIKS